MRCALEGWLARITTTSLAAVTPILGLAQGQPLGPVKLNEVPDQVQSSILTLGIYHSIQQAIRAATRYLSEYSGQENIETAACI